MGADMPRRIIGASDSNVAGHWEPEQLVQLNDRILEELGSAWDDWRTLNLGSLDIGRKTQLRKLIGSTLACEYGASPLIVLKDPRICRMPSIYMDTLTDIGISPAPVLIFRNPLEVVDSLTKRKTFWSADRNTVDGALLWLVHVLEAIHGTRGMKRAIISYDALLSNWQTAVDRIGRQLNIKFRVDKTAAAHQVTDFLNPRLRHNHHTDGDVALDPMLRGWVSDTYEALRLLERSPNSSIAIGKLERIRSVVLGAEPILLAMASVAAAGAREAAEGAIARAKLQMQEQRRKLVEKDARISQLEDQNSTLLGQTENARGEEKRLHDVLDEIYASTSWKITSPLRGLKLGLAKIVRAQRQLFRPDCPSRLASPSTFDRGKTEVKNHSVQMAVISVPKFVRISSLVQNPNARTPVTGHAHSDC